jgi:hypothetical protein
MMSTTPADTLERPPVADLDERALRRCSFDGSGRSVTLEDGQAWHLPRVGSGLLRRSPGLWDRIIRTIPPDNARTIAELDRVVVLLVLANYRVTTTEATALIPADHQARDLAHATVRHLIREGRYAIANYRGPADDDVFEDDR